MTYGSVEELLAGQSAYFDKYNLHRPHQSLNYRTPHSVYFEQLNKKKENLNSILVIPQRDNFI